ncbi:ATP-dependent Clp protease proteolytic subunit [Massilia sp. 2TAF26]|uniref:ATP-dependent Clp protease proteolytic subunit n=1 Tax=Massilia sp. 2TAF26 TaxID=3233012 RepID=UPI003F9B9B0A
MAWKRRRGRSIDWCCTTSSAGQPFERIETDSDRDNYMATSQGVAYGLIDRVLNCRA